VGKKTQPQGMSERKPSDDLKEGLFLLFRAARGAAKEIDASKVEHAVNSGARGLARAIENVGKTLSSELEKSFADKDDKEKDGKEEEKK